MIGIFSDVHGNHAALAAVLASLEQRGATRFLFLGDICGYYPFVEECLALLARRDVLCIRGNHDQVLVDCTRDGKEPPAAYTASYGTALKRTLARLPKAAAATIAAWPETRSEAVGKLRLGLFHGAPWDVLHGRVYPDFKEWHRFDGLPYDVVLLGQTHYQFTRERKGMRIVNPGSVGQPRDRRAVACFSLLDPANGAITHHHAVYDGTAIIADAERHDPGIPYLVERLKTG